MHEEEAVLINDIQGYAHGNFIQRCKAKDTIGGISIIFSNAFHQKIKFQPICLTFRDLF
jgi:hypothetical protein